LGGPSGFPLFAFGWLAFLFRVRKVVFPPLPVSGLPGGLNALEFGHVRGSLAASSG